MSLAKPLIIATRNPGKLSEFRALLSTFEVNVRSLEEFGPIPRIEEDGLTFEDNAVKKARMTARYLGLPALADDSGLVVDALGGMPGVASARFAGEGASDLENNRKLLRAMAGIENRTAAFVCVLAIAVPRGPALIYEGTCKGRITKSLQGAGGFGYDPLFCYPPLGKTFAQMSAEEKNRVSHRGLAMAELKAEFPKVLGWLEQRLREESA